MNPSLAYVVAALNKSAAPPAQPVPFMQDPLLMGGVAFGAMGGDSPQEMAIKGGFGYLAAKALKQWMEQNGQPVPEALKQRANIPDAEPGNVIDPNQPTRPRSVPKSAKWVTDPANPSNGYWSDGNGLWRSNGSMASKREISAFSKWGVQPPGAPLPGAPEAGAGAAGQPPGATQPSAPGAGAGPQTTSATSGVPTNATPVATDATPMTSTRLRQDIARERSGLGAIKRNILGSMGRLGPEDELIERNLAAKEQQMQDLYQKEQIDNIKMRENAARLKAEQLGLRGGEAENYVANKVPEARTELVKEAPKGKYYGSTAERSINIDGKQFYRIPGSSGTTIYTDHLGNQVTDSNTISRIQKEIPKTTYRGDIPIRHESAELRPKTTYATKTPILENKYKTGLGRGIGGAGGALLAGTAANAIADKLDLGDTATGVLTGASALAGGIGGSVLGGRAMGGFQSPFAKLNEFGAAKPGMSLMQRMRPAGRAAGALALLGGAGWLANKFMNKKETPSASTFEPMKEFASNWNSRNYFDPDMPMFVENGLRYRGRS
jgi:hypothetical protein